MITDQEAYKKELSFTTITIAQSVDKHGVWWGFCLGQKLDFISDLFLE